MVVDLSPLVHGARGTSLRVAGVRVGDAAGELERAAVTGAEDADPDEPRSYGPGTVYRRAPDGTLTEISLAERVERTLARGGTLRCGEVALGVRGGRIDEVVVRGRALATLGVAREDDLVARLGPAAGRDHTIDGKRRYHYPERDLVVAWDPRADQLAYLRLGPTAWAEPRLGGPALLAGLIRSYAALAPAPDEPPASGAARVRYQRLDALARALGLGGIAAVMTGAFLDGELAAGRREVLDELAARSPVPERSTRALAPGAAARIAFDQLLRYRHDVDQVARAAEGWLACSDPSLLGMIALQRDLGHAMLSLLSDVDRWLVALLVPDGRTVTRAALIAEHGWPDVALEAMEIEEAYL